MNKNLVFGRVILLFTLMIICTLCLTNNAYTQQQGKGGDKPSKVKADVNPTLTAVLSVLDKAFEEYSVREGNTLWALYEATVDLNTVKGTDGSGAVKIFVFSFGGGKSVEKSSTLSIKLKVPEKLIGPNVTTIIDTEKMASQIAENIALARNAILETKLGRLKSEMTYEMKFPVTTKVEGGFTVPVLVPLEIGAKLSKKNTQVHTIKLLFK